MVYNTVVKSSFLIRGRCDNEIPLKPVSKGNNIKVNTLTSVKYVHKSHRLTILARNVEHFLKIIFSSSLRL